MTPINGSPAYLIRNKYSYRFRMRVPIDLQKIVGKKELRYSLKTGYISAAKTKARFLASQLQLVFRLLSNGAVRSFRESHKDALREYRRREFGELFKEIRKRTAFGYRVDFFPKWVEPEHLLCSSEKYIYPGMTILLGFRRKGN